MLLQSTGQYLSAFAGSQMDGRNKARRNNCNLYIGETMNTSLTKKQLGLAVACALTLGLASGATRAELLPAQEREIWNDASKQVWMNGYGECWHSAFGPPPSPNVVCGPQPIAQYVAPAAKPVVVAAAPQPVYEKVTLDTNVLFDFDKSALRPAGRDTLDDFVGRMKGIGSGTITAIGYADRFGTDSYNQTLSEERVATVKDYLISKGIASTWVQSSGKGELQPTTKAGECEGAKSASTIACLQSDRHVFIEMSGSRIKQ